jgi:Flp pilus assembly pilin Flp
LEHDVKVSAVRLLLGRGQAGQGLAEYALILALVGIASIVAVTFMGGAINQVLSDLGNAL